MRRRSWLNFLICFLVLSSMASDRLSAEQPQPQKNGGGLGDAAKPAQAEKSATVKAPYPTACDAPLDAKEKLLKEEANFTHYRIEFNGIKGDRVPANLYVPRNQPSVKGPLPAVLLQYGIGGNKNTNYIVAVGKEFVGRGFIVLTIDAPGVGERRTKDKKAPAVLGLFGGDQVMHYCGDYSRAIDLLASRPDVDSQRLGFVGISWGAITGITYVAHEPRIKAMASLVGGGNFLGLASTEGAQKAAKEGSKLGDPIYHVARIAPRPLLFVNVTKDQLIMRSWSEALHKAAPDARVVWLDTDHYFNGLNRSEVCVQVIDFMEKALSTKR